MCVGATDNNFMARKVVSETIITVVHLDIVNILKKTTNPETDFVLCMLFDSVMMMNWPFTVKS